MHVWLLAAARFPVIYDVLGQVCRGFVEADGGSYRDVFSLALDVHRVLVNFEK